MNFRRLSTFTINRLIFLLSSFLVLSLAPVYGQIFSGAGTFDRSFGRNGIVFTPPVLFQGFHYVRDIVVQPDGKILAGGYEGPNGVISGSLRLTRYNPNGSLDSSFGTGGIATTVIGSFSRISALALQPDGKIVVGGEASNDLLIARYNSDGSLDASFGNGGYVVTDLAGFEEVSIERAYRVVVFPDGKIAAIGERTAMAYPPYPNDDFKGGIAVLYYNEDGSPDTSKGNWGRVITRLNLRSYGINSAVISNDGGLIVAAFGSGPGKPINPLPTPIILYEGALVKYNADGTLDPQFAAGGIRIEEGLAQYKVLKSLPNGEYMVSFVNKILRLNANGNFTGDIQNGSVSFNGFGYGSENFVVQENGKIVATGILFDGSLQQPRRNVRFLPDGSVDTTFGEGGLGPALPSQPNGFGADQILRLQPDGKILNATTTNGNPHGILIARFNGDTPVTKGSKR